MAEGPRKIVKKFEEDLLQPGERLDVILMDNSLAIESGGQAAGASFDGDETARRLAEHLGHDLANRIGQGGLALTDRRLVGWTWGLVKDSTMQWEVPFPGPRLAYLFGKGRGVERAYMVIDLGDGRFTTIAIQTKTFGFAAKGTRAAFDALLAAFGGAAQRLEA